jgi:hypothetical protein
MDDMPTIGLKAQSISLPTMLDATPKCVTLKMVTVKLQNPNHLKLWARLFKFRAQLASFFTLFL